ncbi:MAG: sulfite exporter TauE/SafE family protein, partial [Burkholderiaceae bacterium]|nr:sulfite exporter TauE/SafE family protein [Burkholderiaceae bacterium]
MIAVDWFLVVLLAACAFLAGLFRRLSGFGGAMVMAPLLIGFFPLVYVIPIVMTIELLAGIWLAKNWKVEKEDRPRIYRLLIASTITLPFGIYIGEQIDPQHLKIIASIAVFWFSLFLLLQPHVRLTLGSTKDHLAGAGAGFLLGSCGFGGPIIALYLGASTLDYRHVRAILSLVVSGLALLGIIFAVLFNESL